MYGMSSLHWDPPAFISIWVIMNCVWVFLVGIIWVIYVKTILEEIHDFDKNIDLKITRKSIWKNILTFKFIFKKLDILQELINKKEPN